MVKLRKPIPKRASKPKRKRPGLAEFAHLGGHGIRLHGKARSQRRLEIFTRAGWRCETYLMNRGDLSSLARCPNPATEWSHRRHGPHKCDCLDPRCSIASCADCHQKIHSLKSGKLKGAAA